MLVRTKAQSFQKEVKNDADQIVPNVVAIHYYVWYDLVYISLYKKKSISNIERFEKHSWSLHFQPY